MALQFIFGGSGSGKSTYLFSTFLEQAKQNPEKEFFVMVPDQFTMSTQKLLCEMSESGGIMNVDVQSFSRLGYRISEELGTKGGTVLDDTGKNLILRRVAELCEEEMSFLKTKLRRPGYIHEVKSMLSEFYQYDISVSDLNDMIEASENKGMLAAKLRDLRVLFIGFKEYMKDKFITSEEALDELCQMIPNSKLLAGSNIVFDGFTGFTPIQLKVLKALMMTAENVYITLNADSESDLETGKEQKLFALSAATYQKLVRIAKEHNYPVDEPLFLNEKPVKRYEKNPELAFLEANLFRYQNHIYDKETKNIFLTEAKSLVSEIQCVCLKIKQLIRENGYLYRDFAIVSGDVSRYEHIFKTEFLRYGIPYYMDQNHSVSANPFIQYLVSGMRILRENYTYESVMRFLRSGMSTLSMDEIDRFEEYLIALGIHGKKMYSNPFTKGDDAPLMEELRGRLMQELDPLFTKCETAKEYVNCLYQFCLKGELQKKCEAFSQGFSEQGDLVRAKEYEKIYPACMDLLNQIYELIGEDKLTLDEFIQIFEAGISEIRIGTIPQNADQVVIGDIERSRLNGTKVLFFVGINDGVIPGKGANGGLLSDMEREFLKEGGIELAPTPRQKIFEQRLYLYQNMTKPMDRLYLSYAKLNGNGDAILPAYLIRTMQALFPRLSLLVESEKMEDVLDKIESREDGLDDLATMLRTFASSEIEPFSEEERALLRNLKILALAYGEEFEFSKLKQGAFFRKEKLMLEKKLADHLYEDHDSASISRVELFAQCAFAHFLRYGLKLQERKEYGFEQVDFGTIYHGILEQIFKTLKEEGRSLVEVSDEEMDQLLNTTLKQVTETYSNQVLYSSARNEHRIWQMQSVLKRNMTTMRYHLMRGDFSPEFLEKSFRLDGPVSIVGKVDRIDLCQKDGKTYVKVIDYKTGNHSFDLNELYYGLKLQLPLYMHAALSFLERYYGKENLIPASMLYDHLFQPVVKEEDLKGLNLSLVSQDKRSEEVEREFQNMLEVQMHKAMRLDGVTLADDAVIAMLDKEFETESDVIKLGRKNGGELKSGAQVCDKLAMETYLDFAAYKTKQLMEQALAGEIDINPVVLEGSQRDSCSFCPYSSVCQRDEQIPGSQKKELKKLPKNQEVEVMRDELNS